MKSPADKQNSLSRIQTKKRSKTLITLARSQLSAVLKLITGHNALAYHASKIDPEIDDTCSLCLETRETFHHFITDCPRLRIARINCAVEDFDGESWKVENLLEFARTPAIEVLLLRA